MLYSELITILRREANDFPQPMKDYATGDGESTQFKLTERPVMEGSYTIKVNSVTQTETTDYSIDRDSGWITFVTAPSGDTGITIDYKYADLNDTGWIHIINDIIKDLDNYGYFKSEVVDDTTLTSTANTIEYSCPDTCKSLVNVWYKRGTEESYDWFSLSEITNWRYSRQSNTLYLGRSIIADYPLKLQYLSEYTLYTATTSTIDVQDEYLNILKLGCMARYYEYILGTKVHVKEKIAKEVTIEKMTELQRLVRHYESRYESGKVRGRPAQPLKVIYPNNRLGGNP